jgi:hypothetical protein
VHLGRRVRGSCLDSSALSCLRALGLRVNSCAASLRHSRGLASARASSVSTMRRRAWASECWALGAGSIWRRAPLFGILDSSGGRRIGRAAGWGSGAGASDPMRRRLSSFAWLLAGARRVVSPVFGSVSWGPIPLSPSSECWVGALPLRVDFVRLGSSDLGAPLFGLPALAPFWAVCFGSRVVSCVHWGPRFRAFESCGLAVGVFGSPHSGSASFFGARIAVRRSFFRSSSGLHLARRLRYGLQQRGLRWCRAPRRALAGPLRVVGAECGSVRCVLIAGPKSWNACGLVAVH